jgi:YVTN family beta-propeller protein
LYVAYEFSNRYSVIDLETGSQIKSIPVERFPHQIASDPAINRIYVTNEGSKSVSVLDADTDTLMDPIRLSGQ